MKERKYRIMKRYYRGREEKVEHYFVVETWRRGGLFFRWGWYPVIKEIGREMERIYAEFDYSEPAQQYLKNLLSILPPDEECKVWEQTKPKG